MQNRVKEEPKRFLYRDFQKFSPELFENDPERAITNQSNDYNTFQQEFERALDQYAPKK